MAHSRLSPQLQRGIEPLASVGMQAPAVICTHLYTDVESNIFFFLKHASETGLCLGRSQLGRSLGEEADRKKMNTVSKSILEEKSSALQMGLIRYVKGNLCKASGFSSSGPRGGAH